MIAHYLQHIVVRISFRYHHIYNGLSPKPSYNFLYKLVEMSFRGFHEFEGLASIMILDDYINDLYDDIYKPLETFTLFYSKGDVSPFKAVACC